MEHLQSPSTIASGVAVLVSIATAYKLKKDIDGISEEQRKHITHLAAGLKQVQECRMRTADLGKISAAIAQRHGNIDGAMKDYDQRIIECNDIITDIDETQQKQAKIIASLKKKLRTQEEANNSLIEMIDQLVEALVNSGIAVNLDKHKTKSKRKNKPKSRKKRNKKKVVSSDSDYNDDNSNACNSITTAYSSDNCTYSSSSDHSSNKKKKKNRKAKEKKGKTKTKRKKKVNSDEGSASSDVALRVRSARTKAAKRKARDHKKKSSTAQDEDALLDSLMPDDDDN